MKKAWIIAAAIIIIFSSCDNAFISAPHIPQPNDNQKKGVIPLNVSTSHGDKRSITVSWDSIPDAELYYIYRADSPLDSFILCGETNENRYTFNVPPGSSVYYRISSVLRGGVESSLSNYIMGTSLAQPVISDITDISEDSAAVTWYMENVSDNTYRKDLLYTVYCFNGAAEVAQIMLEASAISENRAVFTGLTANTRYEYKVEAFLRANQGDSEQSEKMDAATARRFRPGAPLEMRAARGTAVDKIELSFKLPDMVDIALGDNTFDPKPLYFTISKRLYSENHNNEYQLACAYFGVDADSASLKTGGKTFNEYTPGASVTWTDNSVMRGIKYEYQVQSYVDNTNRIISSDASRVNTTGWALSNGEVSYGKPKYTLNNEGKLYSHAELPISFNFDPKGEIYTYTVNAKVEPIEDNEEKDPDANYSFTSVPLNYDDVIDYSFVMNLTQKSTAASPGRGIYSVEVKVGLPGEAEAICIFKALGSLQISEDTKPIVVENFYIQDGYRDQFILIWDNHSNRKYTIEQSNTGEEPWVVIGSVNDDPADDDETVIDEYKHHITGQTPGIIKYFRIRPARDIGAGEFKSGQPVYAQAARTLGIAELSLGSGASYSLITPLWTEAQKADTYRIKYRYTDEDKGYTIAAVVKKEDLTIDAAGKFKYSFRPQGYNDALKAGKEIQIEVDALNEGLRTTAGGDEIMTSSIEVVTTRLVGPALLNVTASKAASPQDITVSWNSVSGADGYYVFRRQFNMTNTAEEGSESVAYYVPSSASSSINVIGKNLVLDASNSRVDTPTVKATASFTNSRYTLKDMYLHDNEYDSAEYNKYTQAYRNQQNDIAQGWSYRYFVVPVIANEPLTAIEFAYNKDGANKNTSIYSYSMRENGVNINYSGASGFEQEGFTVGFGQNVTATKGTYASSGNVNDGIRITWSMPPRLSAVAGFTPRYTLYRRITGGSSWVPVTSINNTTVYVDSPQERGVAYEYMVGIGSAEGSNVSQPQHSNRFLALCASQRDERDRPNMLGYMLDVVRMESVSRNELRDSKNNFAEEVRWYSAGISNSYDSQNFNWGIDGYEVFVMNRNISAGWHTIADMTGIPNQINLNVRVSNTAGGDTLQSGLLKVLRDYKHYFKVRSYVMNGDEKVYCPDPPYTYTNGTASNPHFLENEYVKWGARQITQTEFAQITSLYMARAIEQGNYWTSTWAILARTWRTVNAAANYGGGGNMRHSSNAAVTEWWYEYRNWKTDLQTRAGDWMTFITVDGDIWIVTGASTRPHRYRRANNGYKNNRLVVTGPSDTPHLYSGEVQFGANSADNNANNLRWVDGTVHVIYPSDTAIQTFSLRGQDTAFMFSTDVGGSSSYVNQGNAWR